MIMKAISFGELLKGMLKSHIEYCPELGEEYYIMSLVNTISLQRAYNVETWIRKTLGCENLTPMYSAQLSIGE